MTFLWSLWMYFNGGGFTMIDMPDPMALIVGLLIGYIFPLFSSWGPLYGAILLGLIIYFFRADAPHLYAWAGGVVVVGIFFFLVFGEDMGLIEGWIIAGLWLVEVAGMFFFLKWWMVRSRVKAEQHLAAVAELNRMKREEIRERTGGAVADREFATGEEGDQ